MTSHLTSLHDGAEKVGSYFQPNSLGRILIEILTQFNREHPNSFTARSSFRQKRKMNVNTCQAKSKSHGIHLV